MTTFRYTALLSSLVQHLRIENRIILSMPLFYGFFLHIVTKLVENSMRHRDSLSKNSILQIPKIVPNSKRSKYRVTAFTYFLFLLTFVVSLFYGKINLRYTPPSPHRSTQE